METPNTQIDFLGFLSHKRLRKEISNICDSYSNPWDILGELCQNSVDAIKKYNRKFGEIAKKDHLIKITIDAKSRSITVYDTGHGFSKDKFTELLAPHGTDKENEHDMIGEKGVGLTYTIFSGNHYTMKSISIDAKIEGYVKNAALWRHGKIDDFPFFNKTHWDECKFDPKDTFTEITISDIEKAYSDEVDLFNQSVNVLEFIIRTKTALGHLKKLFDDIQLPLSAQLIYVNITGESNTIDIHPSYMLPSQFTHSKNVVELDEFKKTAGVLNDTQKAKQLAGKCLLKTASTNRAGRRINYHVFLAPSRNFWTEISKKNGIFSTAEDGTETPLYQGGIYVASRGMPTGISLESPRTGQMAYWPAFLMILEDDSITFDLGRKSVPGRTQGLLKEVARDLFNEFLPYIKYIGKDPEVISSTSSTIQQYEKTKTFETIEKLPDLGIPKINYLKHPDGQEAGVVALFHELVAANILKGYFGLRTGYVQTYDLWGKYKIDKAQIADKYAKYANQSGIIDMPIVIEFKFKAESILDDFEDNKKFFNDIDLIVCWDLDVVKFSKQSVTVQPISKSDALFFGSNYMLEWPGSYDLGSAAQKPVLALRKFIDDYLSR